MQHLDARKDTDQSTYVLLIEDDADLAAMLREFLLDEGATAVWVTNGTDGLAVARGVRFDAILTDMGLPDMDGSEVAARLRHSPHLSSTPLVMLTGQTDPDLRDRALASGCDEFFTKPVCLRTLMGSLRSLLRRGRRREDSQQETRTPCRDQYSS